MRVRGLARAVPVLLGLVLAQGCANLEPVRDLANNPDAYKGPGYIAEHRQPRTVFVRPVEDKRGPLEPYAEGLYPVTYTEDDYWDRPMPAMLRDLLYRDLDRAHLFSGVAPSEDEADWVLDPVLLDYHGGVQQRVEGRKVIALVTLHVTVYGPKEADGTRPILRARKYTAPLDLPVSMVSVNPHSIAAACFARVSGELLIDLDEGGRMFDNVTERQARPASMDEVKPWAKPGRE
ncbi:MAG: hypothetical protein R3F30_01785 [Planctomycetota bacterium]